MALLSGVRYKPKFTVVMDSCLILCQLPFNPDVVRWTSVNKTINAVTPLIRIIRGKKCGSGFIREN